MSGRTWTWRTTISRLAGVATAAAVTGWSAIAAANDGTSPADETTIPGGDLVIVGYMVLWGLLGGYLFYVMWRQRGLQREVDELEERVDELYGVGDREGGSGSESGG